MEETGVADSLILATAREHEAVVWTLDSDLKNIKGVKCFLKKQTMAETNNPFVYLRNFMSSSLVNSIGQYCRKLK